MGVKPADILLVEAQLRGYSRTKDGSVNISFRTAREMTNDEIALVDKRFQQNGWLAFKQNELRLEDIPTEEAKITGQISPSKQLYNSLFAKHMNSGGKKEDFAEYYRKTMAGFKRAVDESYEV
jgi:hypothetical protein